MFMLNNGGSQALASLDVCKTPTPAGPIPIPYVNISTTQLAAPGGLVPKVLVTNMPALNQASQLQLSNGNEPGTAGGVMSSKFIGPVSFTNGSLKVMVGGKPAVRMGCMTGQNGTPQNAVGSVMTPSQTKVQVGG
ncbi:DUF4150 domain-containing protein [Paenalcaligenes faecalis]|uniref:DUF4150 domain-containing protein n=1 Tax=Paenalcaligenes faecalis TaxID=2980099 RepID=UPI0022B96C59|nr:DUF4150 domain-containing protein [Paenalcaligenes faecalis]